MLGSTGILLDDTLKAAVQAKNAVARAGYLLDWCKKFREPMISAEIDNGIESRFE